VYCDSCKRSERLDYRRLLNLRDAMARGMCGGLGGLGRWPAPRIKTAEMMRGGALLWGAARVGA